VTVGDRHPPRWAEALLRRLLAPRDRDTITGDLFEEYGESAVPSLGVRRAQIWYVRQVLSLVTLERLGNLVPGSEGRLVMDVRRGVPSVAYVVAGVAALATIVIALLRSRFGPFGPWILYAGLALLLIAIAGSSLAKPRVARRALEAAWPWAVLLGLVLVARFAANALVPPDPFDSAFRRVGESYSLLGDFRRWLVGVGVVSAVLGAGFQGALRSGGVRAGMLTAVAASILGAGLALLAGLAGLPMGVPPGSLVTQMVVIGAILGTIGAFIGRGLAGPGAAPGPDSSTLPAPPGLP